MRMRARGYEVESRWSGERRSLISFGYSSRDSTRLTHLLAAISINDRYCLGVVIRVERSENEVEDTANVGLLYWFEAALVDCHSLLIVVNEVVRVWRKGRGVGVGARISASGEKGSQVAGPKSRNFCLQKLHR